jgi:UDP-N-acetylmuramyl-tripeptide synthetase
LNRDDDAVWGFHKLAADTTRVLSFSILREDADIRAVDIQYTAGGISMRVCALGQCAQLRSTLLGKFNVYNLLAAVGILLARNFSLDEAVAALSQVQPVTGRMEIVGADLEQIPLVVVDYAHTPDALEQALLSLRLHCQGNLWCVFGCGGNRDQGKRSLMGAVAATLADKIILTSDNPRDESVAHIFAQIEQGIAVGTPYLVEPDRSRAVAMAVESAASDDVILLAGKGHENYQEVAGRRTPYSDLDSARQVLLRRCA